MTSVKQTQNYREVKRKAAVGERIKIVGVHNVGLRVGDELTVEHADAQGDIWSVRERAFAGLISYSSSMYGIEYVVLEPVTPALSTDPLFAAFRQFVADNAAAIRAILPGLEAQITQESPAQLAPITRAQVIAKATADVAELTANGKNQTEVLPFGNDFYRRLYNVRFRVNRDKRTVVCEIIGSHSGRKLARAYAKCSPADVFHAEIGKAIALRKALGLTVPSEYTDAPQPEPAVGARVNLHTLKGDFVGVKTIERMLPDKDGEYYGNYAANLVGFFGWAADKQYKVTDDTDVDYSAAEAKEAA
ncbi:hypothetical protein [Paenibacillus sp. FSL R7-269]|uniref:hypothetical protein n=1 Tax=Paenibacillus sp. FSL R7-269 TaxID=1226755 RepID=UPI0004B4474D|nr:hypothetical protein [Paenibacillus sp. FSL R7-269]